MSGTSYFAESESKAFTRQYQNVLKTGFGAQIKRLVTGVAATRERIQCRVRSAGRIVMNHLCTNPTRGTGRIEHKRAIEAVKATGHRGSRRENHGRVRLISIRQKCRLRSILRRSVKKCLTRTYATAGFPAHSRGTPLLRAHARVVSPRTVSVVPPGSSAEIFESRIRLLAIRHADIRSGEPRHRVGVDRSTRLTRYAQPGDRNYYFQSTLHNLPLYWFDVLSVTNQRVKKTYFKDTPPAYTYASKSPAHSPTLFWSILEISGQIIRLPRLFRICGDWDWGLDPLSHFRTSSSLLLIPPPHRDSFGRNIADTVAPMWSIPS